MEEKIRTRLTRAIEERIFPGCVVGVIREGTRAIIPVGKYTYDRDAQAVTEAAVYDVASITKSIPVSSLALSLIDAGKLTPSQKIVEIIPELRTNYREEITLWHLLTQTLDFQTQLSSLKDLLANHILEKIMTTQFPRRPGVVMNYSNATSILLGIFLERATGKKLDVLAEDEFFGPLGMTSTTFHPEKVAVDCVVPTESDPWRGRMIRGEIHDESAYLLREKMIPGSAGLFSTVPDLLYFLQMLLNQGTYNGKQYFSEEMIAVMSANQLGHIGAYGGLGWELYQPRYMGRYCSEHTIGKTGFTGSVVILDIPNDKGLVMLSNYHFPKRKESVAALNQVRRDIADIVFIK
jgi:CubicO group peptidase (beta-lactamase class C family)